MAFTSSRTQAVGMLVISIAINLAFLYGIVARPVISYHLSTPLDYNETIDFSTENLRVEFKLRNKGFSPARLRLAVRFYNMSLHNTESFIVEDEGEFSVLRLPWDVSAHQSEYESFEVAFDSAANATYLVLFYSVEGDWKLEPTTRFHNSFAIYKPERPTALLLKHVSDMRYMRVRSR